MKKFMCILLAIVLVIMCGCSVARLYFDMRANQKIDNVVAVLANSATQPTEPVLTPVYTYEHTAYNAVILESNTSTGEVDYAEVCPRCGHISGHHSETVIQGRSTSFNAWCNVCDESFGYRIGVIIHVDYQ